MQAMNYTETIDYLFNSLPMFSRIGAFAYKEGMENTLALDKYFKHPHKKFKTIHVAGTNGKGSVSHLLAASLQKSGYKTGLYTSPHVKDFRERIRIDGQMITQEFIVQFVAENHSFFETLKPSFFEMTVLMAFEYFAQNQIDVAVVEVGLGGRLDSTNIIVPELSVITNISLDHVNLLGDSLAKIAFEKAGIIKKQIPVVIGESVDETRKIFENKAMEMDSPIFFAQEKHIIKKSTKKVQGKQIFESDFYGEISLGLLGIYQQKNLSTFLTCIDILNKKSFHISQTAVKAACESVIELTGY
jgi:dihydrofolate synthase/folylpolyglutamate synthase